MTPERTAAYLKAYPEPVTLMEVCGSHTASIVKHGLSDLLSGNIRLVSGPGCPVCVTPKSYVDDLIMLSFRPNSCILSFGDLFRVPGSAGSFFAAMAEGGSFRVIYSPLEALDLAVRSPGTAFVVAAIGFETTAPLYAVLLEELAAQNITNVTLATALRTTPAALSYICGSEAVDGFLAPGHVSGIIGADAYLPLCERYRRPFAVAGFEPEQILAALAHILRQLDERRPRVENLYPSVVTASGNRTARELLERYFIPADGYWRGVGRIPASALTLREEYARFHRELRDGGGEENPSCRCGDVMLGRILPGQCALFGSACTPDSPAGACMVSAEGACGIYYAGGSPA